MWLSYTININITYCFGFIIIGPRFNKILRNNKCNIEAITNSLGGYWYNSIIKCKYKFSQC